MSILAIDPGTTQSGWCWFDGRGVRDSGVFDNPEILQMAAAHPADLLALEMIASYGMPVGKEVFETCVWIGRYMQAWRAPDAAMLVYRRDVKLHLCGSARAKDPHIRQALLDRFGPDAVGKKAAPGPLYGVRSHAWAALAVAVTVWDGIHHAAKAA